MRVRWSSIAAVAALALSLPALGETSPEVRALKTSAGAAYAQQQHAECAQLYAQALEQGAEDEAVPYNAACCYAMAGDTNKAFEYLHRTMTAGWQNLTHLEADPDLESLRSHPSWQGIVDLCNVNREKYVQSINRHLLELYEKDQADRTGSEINWNIVAGRDMKRRELVKAILENDGVKTADDAYHAAMVLQHGVEPDDYRVAHELCMRAVEMDADHANARWLAAASWDRYLWSVEKPQIYGTQFQLTDGVWTLEPLDTEAISDEERAVWNVPPIAEAHRRAETRNAHQTRQDQQAEQDPS